MSEMLLQNARRAQELGNLSEAARLYAEILRGNSRNFDALYALGVVHYDRGGFEDARRLLSEAVRLDPRSASAHFAHGCALQRLNRHGQALAAFDQALAIDPYGTEAGLRRANALMALHRGRDAIESYDQYLAVQPSSGEAWHNRGIVLSELKRFEEAITSFGNALALRPDSAESWNNRGNARSELKQFEGAASDHAQALAINPNFPYARGHMVLAKLSCCDWSGLEEELAKVSEGTQAGLPAMVPFGNLMVSSSPADQRQCAQIWMERYAAPRPRLWQGERYAHPRTRIAYLSADFRNHPVALLLAGVLEHHDRTQFETYGLSFGPDDGSDIRARMSLGFEHFIEVRGKSDFEIASLLRELEVDIAVDLMGLTADCRTGIFAFRPAPVQVNYLGYPGTMAVVFMDYIIADCIVIPEDEKGHYSEKVVHLPDTYLPSDDKRRIAERTFDRAEAGLPDGAFVFCSFNNSYKIMPAVFSAWMRILRAVGGSVLWLAEGHGPVQANLRRHAEEEGVDPTRLIFAPHLASADDHLARLRLADLFLDTLPCNAHTTASDALWAGLPVLTCMGSTFAGRVAASLLHALDVPELIAGSLGEYEAMAVSFARNGERLSFLKEKLRQNRDTKPLFDTGRFTRNLEAAFLDMRDRALRGEAPQSFAVPPALP